MADRALSSKSEFTGSRAGEDLEERLRVLTEAVNRNPLMRARLLDTDTTDTAVRGAGLAFVSSQTRSIPHGLGRRAIGFLEVPLVDVPTQFLALIPVAHPDGITSATHITVMAQDSGSIGILVF